MRIIWIGLFGLVGIYARFAIDWVGASWFPWNTFVINATGSGLAGIVYVLGAERQLLPADLLAGIMVGFLGGFTTFSAYALQSFRLIEGGARLPWLLYWLGSPVVGVLACYGGVLIAR